MAAKVDTYNSTLDAASLERAKKELNEDEKNRDGAVETLRTWVLQQKWLNTPTDPSQVYELNMDKYSKVTRIKIVDSSRHSSRILSCKGCLRRAVVEMTTLDYAFLLRFLRTKKFSQLEARKTLENFWKKRSQNRAWYGDKNVKDPKVIELIKTGFLLRLPNVDKEGRIWLMDRPGSLNVDSLVKDFGLDYFFKTFSIIYDWLMLDERAQVNGICVVLDMGGMTLKHNTSIYTPSNLKSFIDLVQGVYPIRVKDLNLYNCPPILEFLVELGTSFMKEKMRNRLTVHKTLVSVYESLEMDLLPDEYLPDNHTGRSETVADITDYMIQELTSDPIMEQINSLSNKDYKVDLKEKPDDLPSESFRKLNID